MGNRYLKLDPEFAYQLKKDINSSEETFYKISQKINAYKLLRKKEAILKNKLKISFTSLKAKISFMESTFPEEERSNAEYNLLQKQKHEKKPVQPARIPDQMHIHHQVQHIQQVENNEIQEQKQEPKKDIYQDLEEIKKNLERFK